ncbi:hypothetical protein LCGC14_0548740 [marine sediment metagenome]|uniref:Uncharacterized protein n=1 Tax=marine sediment metagenome TaxID=412755 RepID=A0A0F9RVG5_9ZZZZ
MSYYNELEIVAIELDNSGQNPRVVYTHKEGRYTEWEFEYSKKHDWYYYYCIGDHPICYYIHKEPILFDSTKYWVSNKLDIPVIEKGDCEKIEILSFSIDKLFPKKAEIDSPPDWCKICKDWFPWDNYCEHLWWDDNEGCAIQL